jgi:hypothetical protein
MNAHVVWFSVQGVLCSLCNGVGIIIKTHDDVLFKWNRMPTVLKNVLLCMMSPARPFNHVANVHIYYTYVCTHPYRTCMLCTEQFLNHSHVRIASQQIEGAVLHYLSS